MSIFEDIFGGIGEVISSVVPSASSTTQTGGGDYGWIGPVLSTGTDLLGGIFAQKAKEKAAEEEYARQVELLKLKASLTGGGGGGGGSDIARKQLLQNAYANWIASNNQSAQLVGGSLSGMGAAAAKAFTRSY